jgi:hypothetical protein
MTSMTPERWQRVKTILYDVLEMPSEQRSPFLAKACAGKFPPDGHWFTYSDENSGQVYVTPFPGPGARIAVTSSGGGDPRWREDGQELFYVADDLTIVSVQVRESEKEFHILSSQPSFRLQLPDNVGFYDVTRDGKRFLVNTRSPREQATPLTIVTNWTLQLYESRSGHPEN